MPQIFRVDSYIVYFWSNENEPLEPIHVHIAEGNPRKDGTKIWITQTGKTIVAHNKKIDAVFSSPYKRAVDTIRDFAESNNLEVKLVDAFRERRVDTGWIEDFTEFCKVQWAEFEKIKFLMPWIVKFTFQSDACVEIQSYHLS